MATNLGGTLLSKCILEFANTTEHDNQKKGKGEPYVVAQIEED